MNNNQRRERSLRLEKRDKKLLRLEKERRELWNQLREAPLRELEEPFQRGWERSFQLRKDARGRKDVNQLERALELIQSYQRCRVFPFREYDCNKKRFVEWKHELGFLTSSDLRRGRVPVELWKFFQITRNRILTHERLQGMLRNGWSGQFWFRYPEYAVSETRPYMVTHERVALPEVEARLSEIERMLMVPSMQGRLLNLAGRKKCSWLCCEEERADWKLERFAMREVQETLEDFYRGEGDFQQGHSLRVIFLEGFFSVCGGIFLTS